jgi:hypothetical protein
MASCSLSIVAKISIHIAFSHGTTRPEHLLQALEQNIRVLLLKDQHGPQPHGALARATDVDTDTLRLLQHLVPAWRVPRDECALALATQVLDLARVLLGQSGEAGVEVVTGGGSVLDKVQAVDFVDDGAEEEGTGGVT